EREATRRVEALSTRGEDLRREAEDLDRKSKDAEERRDGARAALGTGGVGLARAEGADRRPASALQLVGRSLSAAQDSLRKARDERAGLEKRLDRARTDLVDLDGTLAGAEVRREERRAAVTAAEAAREAARQGLAGVRTALGLESAALAEAERAR